MGVLYDLFYLQSGENLQEKFKEFNKKKIIINIRMVSLA